MGIKVFWDDETETILRWEMEAGWTLADFRAARRRSNALTINSGRIFGLLINNNHHQPPKYALSEFQHTLREITAQQSVTVIVNSNMFTKLLVDTLKRLHTPNSGDNSLMFAASVDAARQLIAAHAPAAPMPQARSL